jgi:hypothetical protein
VGRLRQLFFGFGFLDRAAAVTAAVPAALPSRSLLRSDGCCAAKKTPKIVAAAR